jgi:hypothetical protein
MGRTPKGPHHRPDAQGRLQEAISGRAGHGFNDRGTGRFRPDWVTEHDIRLAEYFYVERRSAKLVMLTDGTVLWADELPDSRSSWPMAGIGVQGRPGQLQARGEVVQADRSSRSSRKRLPGRWIPIVPVYWTNVVISKRNLRRGLVKDAMDPAMDEQLLADGDHGIPCPRAESEVADCRRAGRGAREGVQERQPLPNPVLRYKPTDVAASPPRRRSASSRSRLPAGMIEAAFMATQNLSRVMGVFDPAVRGGAQHKSDKTLNAERGQSENTNFDGYDNLTRSIKHTWRIMLSWFPRSTTRSACSGSSGRTGATAGHAEREDAEQGPMGRHREGAERRHRRHLRRGDADRAGIRHEGRKAWRRRWSS